jgi:hypothetical protein
LAKNRLLPGRLKLGRGPQLSPMNVNRILARAVHTARVVSRHYLPIRFDFIEDSFDQCGRALPSLVAKLLQVAGKTIKSQKTCDFGVSGENIPLDPTPPKNRKNVQYLSLVQL